MRTAILIIIFIFMATVALAGPRLSGTQSVAAGGTPERLNATSVFCGTIVVSADGNNTNVVVIGDSSVDATEATRTGTALFPGQTEYLTSSSGRLNVNDTWVDVVTNDEGVSWNCLN